jgi:hypothetical protein
MCVRPLVMLTRRFVRQIPACKKGPNLKTKDSRNHVYTNLHNSFLDVQLTTEVCTSNIKSPCMYQVKCNTIKQRMNAYN